MKTISDVNNKKENVSAGLAIHDYVGWYALVAKFPPIEETPVDFFGCLQNIINIKKDIVAPIDVIWEAEK